MGQNIYGPCAAISPDDRAERRAGAGGAGPIAVGATAMCVNRNIGILAAGKYSFL